MAKRRNLMVSLTHSLTHSLTYLLLIHLLTYLLVAHPLTHLPTHLLTYLLNQVDNFMEKPAETTVSGASNQADASKQVYTINDIPNLLQGLKSSDVAVQVVSMRGFRRLLSCERNPPVQQCIDHGAVPYFVSCLQRHDCTDLQFEVIYSLTHSLTHLHTHSLTHSGCLGINQHCIN